MSRPYGYVGRPAGTPATRLTQRGRNVLDALTLLGCITACWTATVMLPTVTHPTGAAQAPAPPAHGMFNPAAHIDPAQVIHREPGETR